MRKNTDLQINLSDAGQPAETPVHTLAACVFTEDGKAQASAATLGEELRRAVGSCLGAGELKGEEDETLLLHLAPASGARRLLFVGLGARRDFTPSALRRAASVAVRSAREARTPRLHFALPSDTPFAVAELAHVAAEGAILGLYENDFYQAQEDDDQTPFEQITIVASQVDEAARAAVGRGRVVAEAQNWARALADEPGGSLPPREFARRAAEMAAEFGLKVETLGADEIRARGMGGLWGVGKGSDEPPMLIVVRHEPEGAEADGELWAFVGKGITFDTGGISIKPAEHMEEMKSDMAGGAAVLGALRALAQFKCPRRVVGVIPAAENMPSGRSLKPGDVIRTLAGYTIECVDTDAEGRLVLVDGIGYARQLGAARIVDLATLTGSIVVALGDHYTGLFGNDDEWARAVLRAAARAGEPAWRMPATDEYKQKIESPIADFKNYGGRPDATAAALLLSKFAAETPWVHLDIAATSWHDTPQPHAPAGATGTGVRTLVELACGGGS